MTTSIFFIIMFAAVLHASWNAILKGGDDKRLQMTAIVVGHLPFAPIAIYFAPPLDLACWPNLALGAIFHLGYQYYLVESYKKGDLSQVYPIARASAPLLVTLISSIFLNVNLNFSDYLGIIIIALGLIVSSGIYKLKIPTGAVGSALITGLFISAYSLSDGYGGRIGNSPIAFYAWLTVINGFVWLIYIFITSPSSLPKLIGPAKGSLIIGGSASYLAYSLIMYAFSKAPIAVVMALRETSIIFAILLGVLFLNEKITTPKLFGTGLTLIGVVILRLDIL